MTGLAVFGAGRIGAVHAENLHTHPAAQVRYVVDVDAAAAAELASRCGARVASAGDALADRAVAAVVIATSTDTHTGLIEAAAAAGKAIFCEKPIDLDVGRAREAVDAAARCGVRLAIGFNRRHDPAFRRIRDAVAAGAVGSVEQVGITSRDPDPPPADYVARSGGLFRDMMIHDFDMARWLLGEEPVEVFAAGSVLFERSIGEAGDVDSAVAVLRTESGRLCSISNSRHCSYGYDQRIEVFGSSGMLQAGTGGGTGTSTDNATDNATGGGTGTAPAHETPGPPGAHAGAARPFFLERYAEAYRLQMDRFLRGLNGESMDLADGEDGLRALILADCAQNSLATGKAVAVGR